MHVNYPGQFVSRLLTSADSYVGKLRSDEGEHGTTRPIFAKGGCRPWREGWHMGKLLVFTRKHRSEKERSVPNEEAEVILFTGIRYERQKLPEKPEPDLEPRTNKGR